MISALADAATNSIAAGQDAMNAKTLRLIQGQKGNNKSWSVYAPLSKPDISNPGPTQFNVSHEVLTEEQCWSHYNNFMVDLYFDNAPEIEDKL